MIVFHPRTSETKRASEKKDHPRTTFRRDKANVIDSNSKTPPSKFPKLRIRILEGFDKVSQAFPASKTQNLVIFSIIGRNQRKKPVRRIDGPSASVDIRQTLSTPTQKLHRQSFQNFRFVFQKGSTRFPSFQCWEAILIKMKTTFRSKRIS